MFTTLPTAYDASEEWNWAQVEPLYQDLQSRPLTEKNIIHWLGDWKHLRFYLDENYWRHYVATTVDTSDKVARQEYATFLDEVRPPAQAADHKLKIKLLRSGLAPQGMEIPLRNIGWEIELFHEENLPLLNKEMKLTTEYHKIIGAQSVIWDGEEVTLAQLRPIYQKNNRQLREHAWHLAAQRQLHDRGAINDLWTRLMKVRKRIAKNAGQNGYRSYMWKNRLRFDYSPQDCYRFHRAIEEVVVPAAARIYERRRKRLGIKSIRPWDLETDPLGRPPLHPFSSIEELERKTAKIFNRVDPQLGKYFEIMQRDGLLDLENRKDKAPGGYCTEFRLSQRPFIFVNAVGVHEDVQTMLHEGGHAFHVFETGHLHSHLQVQIPLEFMEVASTAMEFLGAPYLPLEEGGFYSRRDAIRARADYLERMIIFWPYMAVVDAFQHWVYENHEQASEPVNCDAKWAELWLRYMPAEDWLGLEDEMETGWQRKVHIHEDPFYYIEYGLSQMGAVQIWHKAIKNQAKAVSDYRKALMLGGTASLPKLYAKAGAKFTFDSHTLREAINLMEAYIQQAGNA
jgi:oligoendopeptidase F